MRGQMTTLHFTGHEPVVFMTGNVGEVQPGSDFVVPDELADAFLTRADVRAPTGDKPGGDKPGGDKPAKPAKPAPTTDSNA